MSEENMKVRSYRPFEEALSEVERELNVRSRCFPNWINQGKVNRVDAQDRLDRLASAFVILNSVSEEMREKFDTMIEERNADPQAQ